MLCLEASRLARNGRDWHHLLELCGLVGARVIDTDGVYRKTGPARVFTTERAAIALYLGVVFASGGA